MGANDLASGNDIKFTIIELKIDCDSSSYYYNDECLDNYDALNLPQNKFCSTWGGASLWVTCIVFSTLFVCIGSLCVQPYFYCPRCCCSRLGPQILFIIAFVLCALADPLWALNDELCMPSDGFDLSLGASCILVIVVSIIIFVTCFVAR